MILNLNDLTNRGVTHVAINGTSYHVGVIYEVNISERGYAKLELCSMDADGKTPIYSFLTLWGAPKLLDIRDEEIKPIVENV